jgi:CheY-like chemotaxis protein
MSGGTVVIVEDVATSAAALEMVFYAIPDIAVIVLPAALDALRLLERADCAVRAVITDLNMPRMDGFEFIERIRAEPRLRRLPIIVISGDTDPQTPERLSALGANAFFSKPYSPAQVRLKLEQLLDANPAQSPP